MIKLARDAFAAAARLRSLATVSALATVAAAWVGGVAPASAETRTLDLFYVHTGERAQITFKRNGKFDPAALKRLNVFLRDWRRNEPTRMDPALFDLVWEVYQKSGARRPITVVSAYRSPTTNNMLRSRSRGVAKNSQHTYGRAMDFFIADVPTSKLRVIALKMQHGGVGYYPTANTPFVHLDVGSVRHWPRMTRSQLMALFPNGRTLYLPSDGKPLPGYEEAAAEYLRYKSGRGSSTGSGGGFSFASSGSPNAYQAMLGRDSIVRPPPGASKNLLAMLFGGGADEEEDSVDSGAGAGGGGGDEDAAPARAAKPAKAAPAPVAVASSAPSDDSDALPGVNAAAPLPFGTKPSAAPKPAAAPTLPPATVVAPEAPPSAAPQTVEALVASLPAAPPKKPDAAEDTAPTVVATVAIPLPAKAPARPVVAPIVLASATPLAKPPELLARNILGNSAPPVLGYADAGMMQANVTGGAVDVLAETARRVMRGTAAAPAQPRAATRTAPAATDDVVDTPLDAGALGLPPPSLTTVADEDPFAEDMMAPDRSDPRLLATTTTVRSMTFATFAAPNARMMPALIAAVDLPGDDSLHAKAVPGPRTDRFWGSATDPIYTASLP